MMEGGKTRFLTEELTVINVEALSKIEDHPWKSTGTAVASTIRW